MACRTKWTVTDTERMLRGLSRRRDRAQCGGDAEPWQLRTANAYQYEKYRPPVQGHACSLAEPSEPTYKSQGTNPRVQAHFRLQVW